MRVEQVQESQGGNPLLQGDLRAGWRVGREACAGQSSGGRGNFFIFQALLKSDAQHMARLRSEAHSYGKIANRHPA